MKRQQPPLRKRPPVSRLARWLAKAALQAKHPMIRQWLGALAHYGEFSDGRPAPQRKRRRTP